MSEDDQRTKNRTAAVFQGKDLEEDSDTAAVTISYQELAFRKLDQALMKKNFWNLNNKLLTPGLDIHHKT